MDHIVYVDTRARELERLLIGYKCMLVRGAEARKVPYGRVKKGDVLYFIRNNAEGEIKARACVVGVYNSESMTREQSVDLILRYQFKLQLTPGQIKRWAGKRYLVLIEVAEIQQLDPFRIDCSTHKYVYDWLPVGDIAGVMV